MINKKVAKATLIIKYINYKLNFSKNSSYDIDLSNIEPLSSILIILLAIV